MFKGDSSRMLKSFVIHGFLAFKAFVFVVAVLIDILFLRSLTDHHYLSKEIILWLLLVLLVCFLMLLPLLYFSDPRVCIYFVSWAGLKLEGLELNVKRSLSLLKLVYFIVEFLYLLVDLLDFAAHHIILLRSPDLLFLEFGIAAHISRLFPLLLQCQIVCKLFFLSVQHVLVWRQVLWKIIMASLRLSIGLPDVFFLLGAPLLLVLCLLEVNLLSRD